MSEWVAVSERLPEVSKWYRVGVLGENKWRPVYWDDGWMTDYEVYCWFDGEPLPPLPPAPED